MDYVDISSAIYQKYCEEAKNRGIAWTMTDYACRQLNVEIFDVYDRNEANHNEYVTHNDIAEEMAEDYLNKLDPEFSKAIENLLAFELSIFIYRNLNGPWGEMIDFFANMRRETIREYFDKTGIEISTGNDLEMIWS